MPNLTLLSFDNAPTFLSTMQQLCYFALTIQVDIPMMPCRLQFDSTYYNPKLISWHYLINLIFSTIFNFFGFFRFVSDSFVVNARVEIFGFTRQWYVVIARQILWNANAWNVNIFLFYFMFIDYKPFYFISIFHFLFILNRLVVSSNRLSMLPDSLTHLKRLSLLDISRNRFLI